MPLKAALLAGPVLLLALLAPSAPAAPTTAGAAERRAEPCVKAAPGRPSGSVFEKEPAMTVDIKARYTAELDSTCGKITIELAAARAPRTVNSFVFLAGRHFFDHSKCHRLTTRGIHVLQCGDPTGTGTGGPGYRFPDENLRGARYPAGTVAMANSGPGTNGSQFFLVYRDARLPASYTPFGKVTGGMEVLRRIAAAGVKGGGGDGAPAAEVVLNKVIIRRG
uniref:Peptidyl-prolyl cis-trans isomerase n=1 Tax=Streptomyces sp. NBC_00049 TaxID=2903617 RepID=A0AAU2K2E1_9ACTN